jgi:RNA polymerase sigma-70 factor (ECF subfamily)
MLGCVHDADDLVQETLLRAWKARRRFEARSSVRHWLFRIATNACLNTLAQRRNRQRLLPTDLAPPTRRMPAGQPADDLPWLEPLPDHDFFNPLGAALAPDALYTQRESVRLAFVAAVQHLPPRQRAVLLLRDVLGWSAAQTAAALDLSVAAANSALQRARQTLAAHFPAGAPEALHTATRVHRQLAARYAAAWERADFTGLIRLLHADAALAMPPWRQWYRGRPAVGAFLRWAFDDAWARRDRTAFRIRRFQANGQTGFALYFRRRGEPRHRAHALQLVALAQGCITRLDFFVRPDLFPLFGLPSELASAPVL